MTDPPSDSSTPAQPQEGPEPVDPKLLHEAILAGTAENRRNARRVFDTLKQFGTVLDALSDSMQNLHQSPANESPAPTTTPPAAGGDHSLLLGLVDLFDRVERIHRAAARRPASASSWWPPAARALTRYEDDRRQLEDAFSILHEHTLDLMQRAGLQRIITDGQPFDPHAMTAVEATERADLPDRSVLDESAAGWRLPSGQILRPAQVRVSRAKPEPTT